MALSPLCLVLLEVFGAVQWLILLGALALGWLLGARNRIGFVRRQGADDPSVADLKQFFQEANDLIQCVDERGYIVFANDAWKKTLGYTGQDLTDFPIAQVIHPQYREHCAKMLADLQKNLGQARVELTFLAGDGREVHVDGSVNARRQPNGQILTRGIFRDITQTKRAEEKLLRTQELLQQTNEIAQVGGWEADLRTNQVHFSEVAKKLLGLPHDFDTSLHSAMDLYKEGQTLTSVKEALTRALKFAEPFDIEVLLQRPDLSDIWVRMIGKAEHEDHWCVRLYGTFQDITDRKEVEQRIRDSEARFRSYVENANDIVFQVDTQGIIQYVSPNWPELLGHAEEEVCGRSLIEFVDPEHVPMAFGVIQDIMATGKKRRTDEYRVQTKDGQWRWHITSAAPLLNEAGAITSFVGIAHDITELKEKEDSLQKAKEQAEEASKAKSMFLANMSHEIRTPLNSVIGFSDLLLKTNMSENQRQYMTSVHHSANALMDLINDILDFSKIEAGKLEIHTDRSDLWVLSEQLIDMVRFKISADQVELLLNLDPDLPRFAWLDAVRLRQILMNLLSNAIKFTESGEIELSIQVLNTWPTPDGAKSELLFSVRDTGIGIRPEKQREIFKAFQQEDGSTTRKYGGTGLGLAIANQLLKLMDSHLELESTPGLGSRFFFRLTCPTEESTQIFSGQIEPPFRRVLIVDDHARNRRILEDMLALQKIESVQAASGPEALRRLDNDPSVDLLILDFYMPGMNGLDIAKKIRSANYKARRLPILLLVSVGNDKTIYQQARKWQVQKVLSKPITIRALNQALIDISNQSSSGVHETEISATEETIDYSGTILVADDNKMNRLLATTMIRKIVPNVTILETIDGQDTLDSYVEHQPNLIFMDVQMPQMSGYEATRQIRTLEKTGHRIPIIALTAGTVKGERERCLEAGMDDYLSKPILLDDMAKILKLYLTKTPQI